MVSGGLIIGCPDLIITCATLPHEILYENTCAYFIGNVVLILRLPICLSWFSLACILFQLFLQENVDVGRTIK